MRPLSEHSGQALSWLEWTLATTVGWVVGLAIAGALLNHLAGSLGRQVSGILLFPAVAVITAFAQRLTLNNNLNLGRAWVAASGIGALVGILGTVLLNRWFSGLLTPIGLISLQDALIGASLGYAQSLVLRWRSRASAIWIGANIIAWSISFQVAYEIDHSLVLSVTDSVGVGLGFASVGVLLGIATGAGLIYVTGNADSFGIPAELRSD